MRTFGGLVKTASGSFSLMIWPASIKNIAGPVAAHHENVLELMHDRPGSPGPWATAALVDNLRRLSTVALGLKWRGAVEGRTSGQGGPTRRLATVGSIFRHIRRRARHHGSRLLTVGDVS